MKCIVVFNLFLTTVEICMSLATEILYVLLDSSTNVTCPSQPCATLSQYWLDNGTLPVVSNVEYHFLPGERHVPANMLLQNLYNFSIIGLVSDPSSSVVLIGCSHLHILSIINSFNVTLANVMFRRCDQPQLINLLINSCYSCTIENVTFMNLGFSGTNLIGRSYLTGLVIKLYRENANFLMFCQGIILNY